MFGVFSRASSFQRLHSFHIGVSRNTSVLLVNSTHIKAIIAAVKLRVFLKAFIKPAWNFVVWMCLIILLASIPMLGNFNSTPGVTLGS